MDPLGRRERLWLAAVLLAGLALRLLYLLEQRSDILFDHPVLDEQRYVDAARALAAHGVGEDHAYWQPPGIIYALMVMFRVAGPGLVAPRVLQILLSLAACWLAFAIGRRLFTTRVAIAACAIMALHGVLVFESSELLPPTWMLCLDLAVLWLLLRAEERKSALWSLAAGLALGMSAVFSPAVLPFAAVAALWLRRASLIGALLLGMTVAIAPVTWRNWARGRELVLVSTNGGLNFFLGNNADYASTFAMRPGRHWEEMTGEPLKRGLSPGAASSYFSRKGWAFYRAQPGAALELLARKGYLYFNGREIPRDTDLYAARASSRVLTALVWPGPLPLPDGLLIPLALVGAALMWRERRKLLLVYSFLFTQALVTSSFFVTARHRVPALAMFALFAAQGVFEMVRRWRSARGAQRFVGPAVALALLVLLNLPTREAAVSYAAELDFYRGIACLRETRESARAVGYFQRSIAVNAADARSWFELGNAYELTRQSERAVDAWRHAAALDPWDSRTLRGISAALMRAGDLDGAITALQTNIDAAQHDAAHYTSDRLNLAFLCARRGQFDRAIEHLRAAQRGDPTSFRAQASRMAGAVEHTPELKDSSFALALRELLRVGPHE